MPRSPALALIVLLLSGVAGCVTTGSGIAPNSNAPTQKQEAARANTELGQRYMQQGKLELAMEKLNRALEVDSSYADAHTVIAVLYERIGNAAKAGEHYRRAAQLKPNSGAEANNYGWFLCNSGKPDEAVPYFDRAIADPFYRTPALALGNAGICLARAGKYDEAEQKLRVALETDQNNTEALYQMASVLYAKRDYFRARAFMQRYEGMARARPETLMLGRNIELQLGNADAARDYTRRLLQDFPNSQQARLLDAPGTS
ncbi:type IV pilus biogenesis/stability protein PilW [Dokdonella koreensis]|uniref:Type IV pilus biogenesis/stability protein PilW n=1 Tax=Dokdonella koreensis DS-123 TaxID=1300342 RepID=A0A160DTT0_9GAMM|nr:type IV pilus biogenesis/stability protein PilW [Dokdonella koreensis]ANB17410.1 Type IV pilus biogenesis/stability protein PilW [Dokdonella koreensis DS-123]